MKRHLLLLFALFGCSEAQEPESLSNLDDLPQCSEQVVTNCWSEANFNAGVQEIPYDEASPFNKLDRLEWSWILWLESRRHFPNEYGTVVVGHEALVAAINSVGRLIEENERLRAEIEELKLLAE